MTAALSSVALAAAPATAHHHHLSRHPAIWLLICAGAVAGIAVGMTGMGGGALMTPMLVLLFGIDPKVAIASDLVSSLTMKPVGAAVHARRHSVQWRLVGWLALGSVPAALAGAWTLNQLGNTVHAQSNIKVALGWALVVAGSSLVLRTVLSARRATDPAARSSEPPSLVRSPLIVLIGVVGGFMVGMTSVGSGSLIIVMLMLVCPKLSSRSLVGTDLAQAVPLVAAAAVGQYLFGHIDFGLAGGLLIGSIPGVYVGSRLSAWAPDGVVRPLLVGLLGASAMSLLFANDTDALTISLVVLVVVGVSVWGAVDAALHSPVSWTLVGRHRRRWVGVQTIGAPVGLGFVTALAYFSRVRRTLADDPPDRLDPAPLA